MMRADPAFIGFLIFGSGALVLPAEGHSLFTDAAATAMWFASIAAGSYSWVLFSRPPGAPPAHAAVKIAIAFAALLLGAFVPLKLVLAGANALNLWSAVIALGFLAWRVMEQTARLGGNPPLTVLRLLPPFLLGAWVLYVWQILADGFSIPPVLLPSPSAIGKALASGVATLFDDFVQTVLKSVLPGYLIGNAIGLGVSLVADRFPFLRRGMLPLGNLFSSLPIIGLAPIMVMWFGFDWQSKAAIVAVMTFFPMLVNTISGLAVTSLVERDLMRTYAATYLQTLLKLRLPAALPFIFNALKINSTLALIGAIVAEFFGSPTVGLGFRISTEAGRMNIVMVWAAIAVAAGVGSAFYGLLASLERKSAFWHPSFRRTA
jgi:NitT/TauT family transport system permease protein